MDFPIFPTVNASLNALAGIFLLAGLNAIKKGNRKLHQQWMTAALATSALFLICYISYHITIHGVVTRYQGEGWLRVVYFFILLTHTPLAALIVPFAIAAVYFAFKGQFEKHKKITRWLMPTWLYVSATGVIIYLMLYIF